MTSGDGHATAHIQDAVALISQCSGWMVEYRVGGGQEMEEQSGKMEDSGEDQGEMGEL